MSLKQIMDISIDPKIKWAKEAVHCGGFKANNCPHNGNFDFTSPHCKECLEDAIEGLKQVGKGINRE